MENNIPRVMIVGTGSGCGKTTITCAILQCLVNRGLNTISFKCGPDYIDPMFHSEIIGTKSRNLDIFLCKENTIKYLFNENSKNLDIAIVEGAMGMYDGLDFNSEKYSSNHISRVIKAPQVLVVDVRGKSFSIVAEISGYLDFGKNNLRGIILNGCSSELYPRYKEMIEKNLSIKVFGYLPKTQEIEIGSRQLGLITAAEIIDLRGKMMLLSNIANETIEIENIIKLAESAEPLDSDDIVVNKEIEGSVNIAVGRDKCFCFYYEDNFDLLKKLGAKITYFSPLYDEKLPENIDAVILGGGYPEENIEALTSNISMIESIKHAKDNGVFIYAECAGFMYMGNQLSIDGKNYKMTGIVNNDFIMTKGLVRFGYSNLTAQKDNLLCKKSETIPCHEFHYSDSNNNGDAFVSESPSGERSYCIIAEDTIITGYPHIIFWGNIDFARNLIKNISEKSKWR